MFRELDNSIYELDYYLDSNVIVRGSRGKSIKLWNGIELKNFSITFIATHSTIRAALSYSWGIIIVEQLIQGELEKLSRFELNHFIKLLYPPPIF